jgi:hypothetical protein
MSPFSQQVRFGVRSPEYRWNGTAIASTTPSQRPYRVAVEISRRHITWFLNGAPVGSVTDSAALSGVPMTLRLSLEGDGQAEMDQASLISDWQRGFPIDTAPLTVSPKKLVAAVRPRAADVRRQSAARTWSVSIDEPHCLGASDVERHIIERSALGTCSIRPS